MKNQKGFIPIIIILVVLIGFVGVYYLGTLKPQQATDTTTLTAVTSGQPSPVTSPAVTVQTSKSTYIAPGSWTTMIILESLKVCLPPKWQADQWGNIYYNRDSGYRPSVTYIQNIPYTSGSRREAYYKFWEIEYPDVRNLVTVNDLNINGNSALLIKLASSIESKQSPEGMAVVWYTSGKLWKASLSNWNMVNSSQTAFLNDFYRMISCSF